MSAVNAELERDAAAIVMLTTVLVASSATAWTLTLTARSRQLWCPPPLPKA